MKSRKRRVRRNPTGGTISPSVLTAIASFVVRTQRPNLLYAFEEELLRRSNKLYDAVLVRHGLRNSAGMMSTIIREVETFFTGAKARQVEMRTADRIREYLGTPSVYLALQ